MSALQNHFQINRPLGTAVVAAAAGLSAYLYIRPVLRHRIKPRATAIARGRTKSEGSKASGSLAGDHPYPPDVFPGGREVDTPYGTIKVFEWGPDDGEKVLLLHGIGTPCVALGDMAKTFVARGCRVMVFGECRGILESLRLTSLDLFGRGYSDAPTGMPYDDRLYISQILLVLASSPLSWTGSASFHILGYSLGGAIAAAFTVYFPHMLRSATLVCPGGLIRPSHVSTKSRLLYSEGLLPEWFIHRLVRSRLEPLNGPSADVPVDDKDEGDLAFDDVSLSRERRTPRVGDAMRWQLETNDGLVGAYVSTIRNAPVYGQHDDLWRRLSQRLAERRVASEVVPPGLPGGRVCLILAENDLVVVKEEWTEDSKTVLGEDGVDIHVVSGGHEIAIAKGEVVAELAIASWKQGAKA